LNDGETVVAASLQPGEVPTKNLRAGDRVAAVQVASGTTSGAEPSRLLAIGTVYALASDAKDPDVVVSIRVSLAEGAPIANAAGQKRLRLMLVPPGATTEALTSQLAAEQPATTPPPSPSDEGSGDSGSNRTTGTTAKQAS